ncbi:MAG: alpha/beta fold hydrolase [Bacteriovorax sp.]|nr:alpha/beta fold hydrolase [Bacteriovorax sp.]
MVITIPSELKSEYPFDSHFLAIQNNQLHYVDEGFGEVILMLHGNPTWSFFYRNLAKHFSKDHRVIVPDHMGCGLSGRPQDYDYTLKNHIDNICQLVEKLDLSNITLVVHDWGGAIGMGLATRYPHLIKKIVVMNTAAFRSIEIPWRINILKNPFGEWFIRKFNGFAGPATFMATTKGLSPLVKKGFTLPYHDFESRIATAKFVKDIPLNENHPTYQTLKDIEEKLITIKAPLLILWGEKDFCFTMSFQKRWQEIFPKARAVTYPTAGHYLVEDERAAVIEEIEKFLKE